MSNFNLTEKKVSLIDSTGNEQLILDFMDYKNFLKNKSRISLHSLEGKNAKTIYTTISKSFSGFQKLFPDCTPTQFMRFATFDAILSSVLYQTAKPQKIAEFGSTNGLLSYLLTDLAGAFHPRTEITYISNTIGNESANYCLDAISAVEHSTEFSFVFSEYHRTNLADKIFDFSILNGDVLFEDPYKVIKEAERVTKQGGVLICVSSGDSLLEAAFRLNFDCCEIYSLSPSESILVAKKEGSSWTVWKEASVTEEYQTLLADFSLNTTKKDIEILQEMLQKIDVLTVKAAEAYELDIKIALIDLKEQILNRILEMQFQKQ